VSRKFCRNVASIYDRAWNKENDPDPSAEICYYANGEPESPR
jgi:hypothetical protein